MTFCLTRALSATLTCLLSFIRHVPIYSLSASTMTLTALPQLRVSCHLRQVHRRVTPCALPTALFEGDATSQYDVVITLAVLVDAGTPFDCAGVRTERHIDVGSPVPNELHGRMMYVAYWARVISLGNDHRTHPKPKRRNGICVYSTASCISQLYFVLF